jgi:hypothetical protein
MFQLHTRYTYTMPQGTISDEGIRLIKRFLDAENLSVDDWKTLNPDSIRSYLPALPHDWQWSWLVAGKGEYVGTFPKRVSKFYWQESKIKSPQRFLSELGNLARQHSSEQITFSFDFTDSIDWEDGDFGDENSCYWSDHAPARGMLEENNALAIRFYESNESDKGIGRAWIAQLSNKRYIAFNGYGIQGDATLKIAQIMATWLGLGYKKIELSNYGQTGGMLWINGTHGYLIGTSEQTAAMDSHDLQFDCDECYSCNNCGDSLTEDEGYSTPSGETYCQSCFYNNYDYCAHCDETYSRDDMSYVENVGDVCDYCRNRRYDYCDRCSEYRVKSDFTKIKDELYCTHCQPEDAPDRED